MDLSVNVDKVFVQAVATIKSLTDLSKTSDLPRPTITDRLNLYGLYNQSTIGNAIINQDIQTGASTSQKKKFEFWLKFKGLTKIEAREEYIKYLLNILNSNIYSNYYNKYPLILTLKNDLDNSWDKLQQLKTTSSSNSQIYTTSGYKDNNYEQFNQAQLNSTPQLPPPPPPRAQSPAVSLYRIASSGLNSNIIRPPSRSHSFSKSRKNSFSNNVNLNVSNDNSTDTNINNKTNINNINNLNTGVITSTNPTSFSTSQSNRYDNTSYEYNNDSNLNIASVDFFKWQNDINNTLLKISTELINLKVQNNNNNNGSNFYKSDDAGHRSISGSTSVSVQTNIQDYKLKKFLTSNNINSTSNEITKIFNSNNNNNITSFDLKNFDLHNNSSNDEEENRKKENLIKWIYVKFLMLFQNLKGKIQHIGLTSISEITSKITFTSIIAYIFFTLFRKVVNFYLKQRFNQDGSKGVRTLYEWVRYLFHKNGRDNNVLAI